MAFNQDKFDELEKTVANQQLELHNFKNEFQNMLHCKQNEKDGIAKYEFEKILEDGTLTTNDDRTDQSVVGIQALGAEQSTRSSTIADTYRSFSARLLGIVDDNNQDTIRNTGTIYMYAVTVITDPSALGSVRSWLTAFGSVMFVLIQIAILRFVVEEAAYNPCDVHEDCPSGNYCRYNPALDSGICNDCQHILFDFSPDQIFISASGAKDQCSDFSDGAEFSAFDTILRFVVEEAAYNPCDVHEDCPSGNYCRYNPALDSGICNDCQQILFDFSPDQKFISASGAKDECSDFTDGAEFSAFDTHYKW
eukprot:CAMPEP_0194446774 /NCGR_PEP_ID=MMETSP0176-20130528/128632_1 /TAXON_ID=216777 /ORGANISM="Proboscia alata, Strain PI-D3" /LENGTH=307 /DNA_ID=CAMNT_0039273537 /DNA_START=104 /DNA_END=1025 /DNA_ORIENTATION=-